MPKISAIIPTYNRSSFLTEAIRCVRGQDFHDYELIVVDDGSTDDTQRTIEPFAGKLTYIYQENRGVSSARNLGLRLANGRYVAFLDSDDLWLKNKLSKQISQMEARPDLMICYTDEVWIRRGKRVNPMKKHAKYSGWIFERCLPLCIISPSSAMMRRELFNEIGLFDENLPVCEDYDFWLRASCRFQIKFIDEKLIVKRGGHEGQLSEKFWGLDRFRVRAIEKILHAGCLSRRQAMAAAEELARKCSILARGFEKRGELQEARIYKELGARYSGGGP